MRTCYNCGNNANPTTVGGKRNVLRLNRAAFSEYHPLSHFGFCVKRRQWLENHRIDCRNWSDPCCFDASRVRIHLPRRVDALMLMLDKCRYTLAATGMVVMTAVGLGLTAFIYW